MNLKIITNNQYRHLIYGYDVPDRIMNEKFDHLDDDDKQDGFFKYRGSWYHLSDFLRADHDQFIGYDGYLSDSFFSGILIKLSSCNESILVSRFYS